MALRAFHCNPALGGFGNETDNAVSFRDFTSKTRTALNNRPRSIEKSSRRDNVSSEPLPRSSISTTGSTTTDAGGGDAFAQIIKELVDNAVDACNSNHSSRDDCGIVKKVRVIIKQVGSDDANQGIDEFTTKRGRTQTNSCHDDSDCAGLVNQNRQELLRIEVTDNGCGMANVEKCVSAFSSSKNGDSTKNSVGSTSISEVDEAMNSNRSLEEGRTAGRYGIGLTLCILHATRLVPNSCVVIKSTVEKSGFINKFKFVVDTQRDNILCIGREKYAKKEKNSSGTTVALLLPVSEMLRNSDYVVNLFKNCITYSPSKFSVGRD